MRACTFFGHQNTPDSIRPKLKQAIEELIVNQDVSMFYVGNHGQFDTMAKNLRKRGKLPLSYGDFRFIQMLERRYSNTLCRNFSTSCSKKLILSCSYLG